MYVYILSEINYYYYYYYYYYKLYLICLVKLVYRKTIYIDIHIANNFKKSNQFKIILNLFTMLNNFKIYNNE